VKTCQVLIAFVVCASAPMGFSMNASKKVATQSAREESQTLAWKKVESSKVCMVTDMNFERAQIPVKVKGATYYGCCENCKSRLAEDATVRTAVDPVSGKTVDKAKASIAANAEGNVVYFENDTNLKTFITSKN